MENKNNSLYALEVAASICVVFIHCSFPWKLGIIVNALSRFAVPLFFLVSGYYLWNPQVMIEDAGKKIRLRKKIHHIAIYTLASFLFYLIFNICVGYLNHGGQYLSVWLKEYGNFSQVWACLLFNDTLPLSGHLWFLVALLYVYIFLYFIQGSGLERKLNKIWPWILVFHILFRICMSITGVETLAGIPVYIWVRNWVFLGLPMVYAGIQIREGGKGWLKNFMEYSMGKVGCLPLLLVSVGLTCIEAIWVDTCYHDDRELYLGTLLMIPILFYQVMQKPKAVMPGWVLSWGQKYLLPIYVLHMAVIWFVNRYLAVFQLNDLWLIRYLRPILVVLISYMTVRILDKMQELFKLRI